jgi:hypothetical protein
MGDRTLASITIASAKKNGARRKSFVKILFKALPTCAIFPSFL